MNGNQLTTLLAGLFNGLTAIEGHQWVAIDACDAAGDIVQVRLSEAAGGPVAAHCNSTKGTGTMHDLHYRLAQQREAMGL